MHSELASVKGIVALSPQTALDEAQNFLIQQGYSLLERTDTSLTVQRRAPDHADGQGHFTLTVEARPQQEGGVRIKVMGDDREGMQERQAAWVGWSESLPKKPETQTDEPGGQRTTQERRTYSVRWILMILGALLLLSVPAIVLAGLTGGVMSSKNVSPEPENDKAQNQEKPEANKKR